MGPTNFPIGASAMWAGSFRVHKRSSRVPGQISIVPARAAMQLAKIQKIPIASTPSRGELAGYLISSLTNEPRNKHTNYSSGLFKRGQHLPGVTSPFHQLRAEWAF